jgi:hypothetical protein
MDQEEGRSVLRIGNRAPVRLAEARLAQTSERRLWRSLDKEATARRKNVSMT